MARRDVRGVSLPATRAELATARAHEEAVVTRISELRGAVRPGISERVVAIVAEAREIFGSSTARFLTSPHPELGGETPIQVAQTPEGASRVAQVLGHIRHGICA